MRNPTFYAAVLIAALALPATEAMASDKVYRWTDENGHVHFGDNPPERATAEVIDMGSAASTGVQATAQPSSPINPQEPSRAQQQRDERELLRKENAETKKALTAGCQSRRDTVAQLEPSTRVMVTTEEGEVYRMDDNDRMSELAKLKSYISENCQD